MYTREGRLFFVLLLCKIQRDAICRNQEPTERKLVTGIQRSMGWGIFVNENSFKMYLMSFVTHLNNLTVSTVFLERKMFASEFVCRMKISNIT